MKLKSLEVHGFKTFPDKTRLDFTDGITAVVGPNGSGKSNISDAIRWVLGEQSAKALRCSKMEDVIFNGTQQRKKTGYAQVTLTIDNTDRALAFDGDDVAVTRRYYRSGNSEYLINNTVVRLQDIHELFMDTGLGRDGYSMIGQGKIDSIGATKGEDRREIFEEAAGISKFRYKKIEAERRLERTEDDLIRLRDIISELELRVEPLRIQSEKAQSFLVYSEEKRGLEIALWLRGLEKTAAAVREQEDKISVATQQYQEMEASLESLHEESEQIYTKQNESAIKLEQLRRDVSSADEAAAEKRSQSAVIRSDIRHNEETVSRLERDIESCREDGKRLQDEISEKKTAIEEHEKLLSEQQTKETELTRELLTLKTGESASSEKLAQINASLAELTAQESDAKIDYMTSSSSINELNERCGLLDNTIRAKSSQIETLEQIISDYRKMETDQKAESERLRKASGELVLRTAEKRKSCDEIKAQAEKLGLDARQIFGRAKMLEDLERNLEGFAHSVKTVMRESEKGTLKGIRGPVSRVLKTPSEYSTAIEIALGAAMQNIVTETDTDAKEAIAYLKKHDGGRATFLPMSVIKGRDLNETGLEDCEGFIGIASSLCSCDECYNGILMNLLGRIVVVQDIDKALKIARKYSYRFRIVTLDGQVVNAGGSLTGGSLSKNTGLLGRKTEIENLYKKAETVSAQAEQENKIYENELNQLSELEAEAEKNRQDISSVNTDVIKLEAEIRSRTAELEAARSALSDAQTERETFGCRLDMLSEAMKKARGRMDEFRSDISRKEEAVRALSGSKDELVRKREQISEKLQEVRLASMTVSKDIAGVSSEIEAIRQRIESDEAQIRQRENEIGSIRRANLGLIPQAETLDSEAAALVKKTEQMKTEIEVLNSERMELEKRNTELRKLELEKTTERERLGGELSRLDDKKKSLQKSYDDTVTQLWEEYELTVKEAWESAAKVTEPGKAQRRLAELKQKIRGLGSVNVSAIEEYKEVKERYEFMTEQVGDIEKSRSELLRLITDLTKQMREIFIERFNDINRNFSATFVELFGGGKASLSLSDPENVLTTGIEITVEPPGKIVSHIELLSGGEKALVAIALYFAIMKVSPAPFCVMDEIEAALDDVNVYRFAAYLRRMNDRTQFICITHRRGTMEEADVLYGVTMQDRGISKLLELKASEIEQKLGMKTR